MKIKVAILSVVLFSMSVISIRAQYTVGVFVDDTISYFGGGGTCYPDPIMLFYLPPSTVTGIDHVFQFSVPASDSVVANGVTYYSGIHSVIINNGIVLYSPSNTVSGGVVKRVGTPQIANQTYPCNYVIASTGGQCPTNGDFTFINICYVLPASSVQNSLVNKNNVYLYQTSTGIFKVSSTDKNLEQVIITDNAGRIVISCTNNFSEINLTKFSPGVYFYTLTDEKENVFRGRIVKE